MRDRLSRPGDYAQWVQPASVDLWRTTYYQRLTGGDPVWEWVTGSVLRPVLAELDPPELARVVADCRSHYQTEYPSDPSGITTLPFSRLFMVARVPATRHRV